MARRIEALPEADTRCHTAHIRGMLDETARHCRLDIGKVTEPRALALFETTAEVLQGLLTAYDHYDAGVEPGMRHKPM